MTFFFFKLCLNRNLTFKIKSEKLTLECYLEKKYYTGQLRQHAIKSKNISSKSATSAKINNTFTNHTVHCKHIKKTSTKSRPTASTKKPVVLSKRSTVSTKSPVTSTKRKAVSTKKNTVPTKRPIVSTKINNQLVLPLQHTDTAFEVLRATYNYIKFAVSLTYFSREINCR